MIDTKKSSFDEDDNERSFDVYLVGAQDGARVGSYVGAHVGAHVGFDAGANEGAIVGFHTGVAYGSEVGFSVGLYVSYTSIVFGKALSPMLVSERGIITDSKL